MDDLNLMSFDERQNKWRTYFLDVAEAISKASKDPCQVGAIIVRDNLIISTGYNGLARGVSNERNMYQDKDEKLKWMCHAEFNAIMNAARIGVTVLGADLYVNKFPCIICCNSIIQAGIKIVHTDDDGYWTNDPIDEGNSRTEILLDHARKNLGVEIVAPNHPNKAYHSAPLPLESANG